MIRALLLAPSSVAGGAPRVLASLARRLPAAGVEPTAVLLEEGPLEEWLAAAGCPVTVLPAGRFRQAHRTARTLASLHALIRRTGAHVVLCNESKGHVYGGLAAASARVPAVWWQHGVPERGRIERAAALAPAAAVVCVGQLAVEAQRLVTPHRPIEKILLGVPVDEIAARRGSGAAVRAACGWEGSRVVGIVARLQPWKGQATFLEAAAQLAGSHADVRFAVVGGAILGTEGSYPDDLHRQAQRLGIADRVHFAGHQDDVFAWLDALDVAVHASTREPGGTVVIETLALGKPLVAAAEGSPLETVVDGVSGLLCPPREPELLAESVRRLLDDPALAARLAAGALARAQEFTEERMAGRFAELFRRVTAPRRAHAA